LIHQHLRQAQGNDMTVFIGFGSGGAEAGEGGLNQVYADEGGEQQSPFADDGNQQNRNQNHDPGEYSHSLFYFHFVS
jgi:hypothetical protein